MQQDTAWRFRTGSALPATCNPDAGDIFYKTVDPGKGPYYASAVDTWLPFSTAVPGVATLLQSYAKASLPAPGNTGQLARVSDLNRGIWMDQGNQWFPTSGGWYNVMEFGARADTRTAADGIMVALSTTLTSATAAFVAADVGKVIKVAGAGTAGADLITTIAAWGSATTVTLTGACVTDVTGAAISFATSDTAAFQAAVDAAGAAGGGPVVVPNGTYGLAGGVDIGLQATWIMMMPGAVLDFYAQTGVVDAAFHFSPPTLAYISRCGMVGGQIRAQGTTAAAKIAVRLTAVLSFVLRDTCISGFNLANGTALYVEGGTLGSSIDWRVQSCYLSKNFYGVHATGGAATWLATEGAVTDTRIELPDEDVAGVGILIDDCDTLRINRVEINSTKVAPATSKGIYVNNVYGKTGQIYINDCFIEQVYDGIVVAVNAGGTSISDVSGSGLTHRLIVDNSHMARINMGRNGGWWDNGNVFEGMFRLGWANPFEFGYLVDDGYFPKTQQLPRIINQVYGSNRPAAVVKEYQELRIGQPIYASSLTHAWWQRIHTGECGHIKLPVGLIYSKYKCNAIANDRCAILLFPISITAAAMVRTGNVYVEGLAEDVVNHEVYFKVVHPLADGTEEFYFVVCNRDIDQDNIIVGVAV